MRLHKFATWRHRATDTRDGAPERRLVGAKIPTLTTLSSRSQGTNQMTHRQRIFLLAPLRSPEKYRHESAAAAHAHRLHEIPTPPSADKTGLEQALLLSRRSFLYLPTHDHSARTILDHRVLVSIMSWNPRPSVMCAISTRGMVAAGKRSPQRVRGKSVSASSRFAVCESCRRVTRLQLLILVLVSFSLLRRRNE